MRPVFVEITLTDGGDLIRGEPQKRARVGSGKPRDRRVGADSVVSELLPPGSASSVPEMRQAGHGDDQCPDLPRGMDT